MQPESSDGFASVGTILPKEEAALLPGGLFACWNAFFPGIAAGRMLRIQSANEDFGNALGSSL